MAKPKRTFSADVGQRSVGTAGPDQIEFDFDTIFAMFDPNEDNGGIKAENIVQKSLTEDVLADNAASDRVIGNRTVIPVKADTNVLTLNQALNAIVYLLNKIKGSEDWLSEPSKSIEQLNSIIGVNRTDFDNHVQDEIMHLTSVESNQLQLAFGHISQSAPHSGHETPAGAQQKINTAINIHINSSDHDNRYYTKEELREYLQTGDTIIKYEVFIIVNGNNGDGTFTYMNSNEELITGELNEFGHQIFTLTKGVYTPGKNAIEAIVNDTLHRSQASGGLAEIDNSHVALTSPEGNGAEITFKYFQNVGLTNEHNVVISPIKPPDIEGNTVWFKVVED